MLEKLAVGFVEACGRASGLRDRIHLIKHRMKSAERIEKKLRGKMLASPRDSLPINGRNLFARINDLAGVRVIHLHTGQLAAILSGIHEVCVEEQYSVVEPATGHCWDLEYEAIYREAGVIPRSRDSMYSSVHLVLGANKYNPITFEVQVRTLAEELWGEVSHKAVYEDAEPSRSVEQQLRVLARMTSGATRLIDCIFESVERRDVGGGNQARRES